MKLLDFISSSLVKSLEAWLSGILVLMYQHCLVSVLNLIIYLNRVFDKRKKCFAFVYVTKYYFTVIQKVPF